jgi:hypothetical protein
MAEFKRKTLLLSSGKQLKLYGNSIAIGKSLEIGEGYRPNIYGYNEERPAGNSLAPVLNPFRLTREELLELADYNIQLWMDLKRNIYKYGTDDPKVFDMEIPVPKKPAGPAAKPGKPEPDHKKPGS